MSIMAAIVSILDCFVFFIAETNYLFTFKTVNDAGTSEPSSQLNCTTKTSCKLIIILYHWDNKFDI